MEVELVIGGDIFMFNCYGSVMVVNDFILNVINFMELFYDDFSFLYLIVDQFVVILVGVNFWMIFNDVFIIFDDFVVWAGFNFLFYDVGQIWMVNDIQGCGSGFGNFGFIGCV